MKLCAIIPSYNHVQNIGLIIEGLRAENLPIFIIDDGSNDTARKALDAFHTKAGCIEVHHFSRNQGKGAAVMHGFRLAEAAGYTHALQIDADGQHDLKAIPRLIALASAHPDALISGQPIYDASIPMGRKIGRWVTHIWVWIETLSFRITDSMCGFRIYPLAPINALMKHREPGRYMEFDTEIMVRLFWQGVDPVMTPVSVIYPPDNTSNFRLWRDNWRISLMHARLFLTMLLHMPAIIQRRHAPDTPSHWSAYRERGGYWGLLFCVRTYQILGQGICQFILFPIVMYFYLTGTAQRKASVVFLTRALKRPPSFPETCRQYMNFSVRALDVLRAWTGGLAKESITATHPEELASIVDDPRGGLLIVAHLGNTEVARAVLDKKTRDRITVLVHTHHARNWHRLFQKVCPESTVNMVQVTEIGPATVIDLRQRVERGEWIVIAGDRTSVLTESSTYVPFLGLDAPFPEGPWILGALLECPIYLLFCLKDGHKFSLTMERFSENIQLPRATRKESLRACIAQYVTRLEHYSTLFPLQWYNFFDFWAPK